MGRFELFKTQWLTWWSDTVPQLLFLFGLKMFRDQLRCLFKIFSIFQFVYQQLSYKITLSIIFDFVPLFNSLKAAEHVVCQNLRRFLFIIRRAIKLLIKDLSQGVNLLNKEIILNFLGLLSEILLGIIDQLTEVFSLGLPQPIGINFVYLQLSIEVGLTLKITIIGSQFIKIWIYTNLNRVHLFLVESFFLLYFLRFFNIIDFFLFL